MTLVAYGLMI